VRLEIDAIVKAVLGSTSDDWVYFEYPADPEQRHYGHAAYKPNAAIWLDWGRYCVRDFHEPWIDNFPDHSTHSAHIFYVECFYLGDVVAQKVLVSVDGERAILPLGKRTRSDGKPISDTTPSEYVVEVSLENELWARLVHGIEHPTADFDRQFAIAKMKRV
jgi:hypothetical protein